MVVLTPQSNRVDAAHAAHGPGAAPVPGRCSSLWRRWRRALGWTPGSTGGGTRTAYRAASAFALALFVITLGTASEAQAPAPKRVAVVAERYDFTPSRIRVAAGTPLEITLTSEDTMHGFRIVGTDVNVAIPKRGRGPITVQFRPEKPGRYIFECSRMCGAGHNFMRGEIIVSEASH
jgi:plastocyanin